jgi:hypothetical protein
MRSRLIIWKISKWYNQWSADLSFFSVSPILLHPNALQEFDLERTFVISSMSDGVDPPVPRYIR